MGDYVLAVIKDPEKLSERCDEINVFENQAQVRNIVSKLKETLKAHKDLMALAAPQLGYKYRIFCIRFADEEIQTFVNPMITKRQGKCLMIEHTDALPGKEFMIQRSERVMAGYQKASGQYNELSLKNPLAAVFESMLDVIDGTLFFKYETMGLPIDKDYYKASQEEKDDLHKWYFETFLPTRLQQLEETAKNDEDIQKLQDQIKYFTSVIEGETEIVPVYGDKVDLENSSVKIKENEDKLRKEYLDGLKKNLGVE